MRLLYPLLAFASLAGAAEIKLSPSGPTKTPQAALEAARATNKPVRILVADGTYAMTEPLVFGPEDSGVTCEATPGAKPVFTGGREITGWSEVEKGLWKAPLPDKSWNFEQLWVNGRRAIRARTPNKGFQHLDGSVGAGVFPDLKENFNFHAFTLHEPEYDMLKTIPAAERDGVLITVTHAWAVGQCRIESLNDDFLAVKIKGRASYPFIEFEPDQRFWMENFRAALDAPGEWYLDRENGEVLYRPRKSEVLDQSLFIAPIAEKFVVAKGVKNLAFRGIAFRHAQYLYPTGGLHDRQAATGLGAALEFEDCANVRIESCEIGHVGEYGVYFKNGCSDSTLTKSHLHDLGGGGVRIGETARPEESRVCHNLVVDNCILQHGGRLHPSACGVVLTHTRQCAVTHCDIGDFYYTGVSAGWNWGYGDTASRETLVENNHVGGMRYFYAPTHAWTSCVAVGALRCLWEMEEDSSLKADYAAGLRASAILAAECLPLAEKFDPANPATFSGDWRSAMMPLWKEQTTEQEAVDLAIAQVKAFGKISPRRNSEANFIREPSAAAWIVSLCPDPRILRDHLPAIGRLIRRHDYARLHYVTFFWVETAWWRMKDIPV